MATRPPRTPRQAQTFVAILPGPSRATSVAVAVCRHRRDRHSLIEPPFPVTAQAATESAATVALLYPSWPTPEPIQVGRAPAARRRQTGRHAGRANARSPPTSLKLSSPHPPNGYLPCRPTAFPLARAAAAACLLRTATWAAAGAASTVPPPTRGVNAHISPRIKRPATQGKIRTRAATTARRAPRPLRAAQKSCGHAPVRRVVPQRPAHPRSRRTTCRRRVSPRRSPRHGHGESHFGTSPTTSPARGPPGQRPSSPSTSPRPHQLPPWRRRGWPYRRPRRSWRGRRGGVVAPPLQAPTPCRRRHHSPPRQPAAASPAVAASPPPATRAPEAAAVAPGRPAATAVTDGSPLEAAPPRPSVLPAAVLVMAEGEARGGFPSPTREYPPTAATIALAATRRIPRRGAGGRRGGGGDHRPAARRCRRLSHQAANRCRHCRPVAVVIAAQFSRRRSPRRRQEPSCRESRGGHPTGGRCRRHCHRRRGATLGRLHGGVGCRSGG